MKYNSDILRHLHGELHDILGEVARVCDIASIPYFLQGGTAIGVHFFEDIVPWDDDIDIVMLRKDFRRLEKILHNMQSEEYVYQSMRSDIDARMRFAAPRTGMQVVRACHT